MYEVFFESGSIVFTADRHLHAGKVIPVDREADLWPVFTQWRTHAHAGDLVLLSDHPSAAFRRFSLMFELIEAAGGMVFHPGGEYLFIFRKGKWDLPKGKIDEGELAEQAAIREVEEECGISGLHIRGELPAGFHVYLSPEGIWMLKKTRWFLMEVPRASPLYPQKSEDIEEARWIRPDDFSLILPNAYPIVHRLIQHLSGLGNL